MESMLNDIRNAVTGKNDEKPQQSPFHVGIDSKDKQEGSGPNPTAEEIEQMLTFLTQLESLKSSNPEEFRETLKSLGIPVSDSNENNDDILMELKQSMKSYQSETHSTAKISLPDGKNVLGSDGIEKKMKGKWIDPLPGFVIETSLLSSNYNLKVPKRVIINLCSHEDIDVPSMKQRINEDGESVEGLNIPMSVGPQYEIEVTNEISSNEASIIAYDVIVHDSVLKESSEDETGKYRDFICQLCIQYIESKLNQPSDKSKRQTESLIELEKRYVLPNETYIGKDPNSKPASQYIQDRKNMPKIEILDDKNAKQLVNKSVKQTAQPKSVVPQIELPIHYHLAWIRDNGDEIKVNANIEDYIDPIMEVPYDDIRRLTLKAEVTLPILNRSDVTVSISPYKLQLRVIHHKMLKVHFPHMIDVNNSSYTFHRIEGFTQKYLIVIDLPIDSVSWSAGPDPGSIPWSLAQALNEDNNIYQSIKPSSSESSNSNIRSVNEEEALPEDKFHIRLPKDVDQYTGVPKDNQGHEQDPDYFPEDRFHRLDASSSYIISQREQAIKDKQAKHDKEKAERINDPNVEYVDIKDYQPGGKYGPSIKPANETKSMTPVSEELVKASNIVAEVLNKKTDSKMSSTLWTELLD